MQPRKVIQNIHSEPYYALWHVCNNIQKMSAWWRRQLKTTSLNLCFPVYATTLQFDLIITHSVSHIIENTRITWVLINLVLNGISAQKSYLMPLNHIIYLRRLKFFKNASRNEHSNSVMCNILKYYIDSNELYSILSKCNVQFHWTFAKIKAGIYLNFKSKLRSS